MLAIGGAPPGQAYRPEGWEVFAPLLPLFASGDYEEGADRANELLASEPRLGRSTTTPPASRAAPAGSRARSRHLKRALELSPDLAESARQDDDLAAIREQPAFAEIVGG